MWQVLGPPRGATIQQTVTQPNNSVSTSSNSSIRCLSVTVARRNWRIIQRVLHLCRTSVKERLPQTDFNPKTPEVNIQEIFIVARIKRHNGVKTCACSPSIFWKLTKQEIHIYWNSLITPYLNQCVRRSGPIVDCPDSNTVTSFCPSWSAVIIWSMVWVVQYSVPANTSSLNGLCPAGTAKTVKLNPTTKVRTAS